MHEMSDPGFSGKNKKNINLLSPDFAHGVVKIKPLLLQYLS